MDLGGILLARHGETNDNVEPLRFQGWTDTPLNDTGRRQAHELAEKVAAEDRVAWLWASADDAAPVALLAIDGEFLEPKEKLVVDEPEQRVVAALTDIHAAGPLPALVVCHGGSIRVVLCKRDPRGLDAFHDFDVPNVAVVPL